MTPDRFEQITSRYRSLRVAIVGDFCLDRYFEIDPAQNERSIETGLPVYNVARVRCQPGAAGTILNNLVALGLQEIFAIGFCGVDGEGFELRRALQERPGVRLDAFLESPERRTFTYSKPLVLHPSGPPEELNRLDIKNWTPTPPGLSAVLGSRLRKIAPGLDAVILMDQVDLAETGVVTADLLKTIADLSIEHPHLPILADSRRGLHCFPPLIFKMNHTELARFPGLSMAAEPDTVRDNAARLAQHNGRPVFVTLAERGIVGALPNGQTAHVPARPVRGPIDIVGAGDSVTANLATALASGAELGEAMELAMFAASTVIHQLGTTGTASVDQLREQLSLSFAP
jgi:rfaE bifunctional protein kinase chain/domain